MAGQFKDKKAEFDRTAREWTKNYANPEKIRKDKIEKIIEMGFSQAQAISALESVSWDEQEAIQKLLS